jgi:hypothetical protein
MIKTKYVIFTLFALCLLACTPKDEKELIGGGTHYLLTARECNYAWAFNAYIKQIPHQGFVQTKISSLKKDTTLKASDFILGFTTCNVDIKDIKKQPDWEGYQEAYKKYGESLLIDFPPFIVLSTKPDKMADKEDPVIETRLKQQLENRYTRAVYDMPAAHLVYVDYRLTWLKDIKITSSAEIAGRAPGQSLTDLFVVEDYFRNHAFIVTSNKNVITDYKKIVGISLSQYLSYKPMAPAEIYLRFKDNVSVSAPVTAQFTIELVTGEDKSIKTTAATVKLAP